MLMEKRSENGMTLGEAKETAIMLAKAAWLWYTGATEIPAALLYS
jgi:hypothetical protein